MLKVVRVLLAVTVALVLCVGPLLAEDLNPPPWRGMPRTTFQQWEFSTPDDTPAPDLVNNPYGSSTMVVVPGPGMGWQNVWEGRQGVWQLSGEMTADIWNVEGGPFKDIQVQLTWCPQIQGQRPNLIEVLSQSPAAQLQEMPLGNGWFYTRYNIRIYPNPVFEQVRIWGEINVDELVIDTFCPEPSGLLALSGGLLGLLGFVRRRRA